MPTTTLETAVPVPGLMANKLYIKLLLGRKDPGSLLPFKMKIKMWMDLKGA